MSHAKINIGGEIYTIEGAYTKKSAESRAVITKKTGLFKSVKVIEKDGKYLLCVKGIARDLTGLTGESLMKEIGSFVELNPSKEHRAKKPKRTPKYSASLMHRCKSKKR